MAWTRKLANGTYRGGYRDAYGKQKTAPGAFTHKAAAMRAANAKESEVRELRTKDTPITWGEWSREWLTHRDIAESTKLTDQQRIDRHVMPRWGTVALSEIVRPDVKRWVTDLRKDHAPTTVNRIVGLLNTSLREAVDHELIHTNPAQGVRLSVGGASHERFLTKDELASVCEHLSPQWANLTNLLAYTGLRWGEAAGLQAKRFDRERGVILVAEVWDEKTGTMKAYPKGGKRRTVPVPKWLHTAIGNTDPVILSPRGERPRSRSLRRALDDAATIAKVEPFRIHDLRHSYSSWIVQAGVPVEELRRLLGHTSIQTTQRYAHLADVPSEDVLNALL